MSQNMPEVKGVVLDAWMSLLKERFGPQVVSEKLVLLAAEDRALVSTKFLASGWYPFQTLYSLRKLSHHLLSSRADRDFDVEIGRYMAHHAFTGVYKILVAKNPIKQAEKLTQVNELIFNGGREMEVEVTGPASCLVRYWYTDGMTGSRAICGSHVGFVSEIMSLSGAIDIKCVRQPKCVAKGDDCCELVFEWES